MLVVVVSSTGMVVRVASVRFGETNTGAQFVGMCVLVGGVWWACLSMKLSVV